MTKLHNTKANVFLGKYDTVVSGGSVAGILCAAEHARKGEKVVVIESRGSLAWEITRARQTLPPRLESGSAKQAAGEWISFMQSAEALDELGWEPVACEMAVDEYVESLGIEVLFQVRPLKVERCGDLTEVWLTAKEGIAHLQAATFIDCEKGTAAAEGEAHSFWNITLIAASIPHVITDEVELNGLRIPVRLRPSRYAEEVLVDVCYPHARFPGVPAELTFGRDLTALFPKLRALHEGLKNAKLALISDEPWVLPVSSGQERGTVWQQHENAWNGLFHSQAAVMSK